MLTMNTVRRRLVVVLLAIGVSSLLPTLISAAADPIQRCEVDKLTVARIRQVCLANDVMKARLGRPSDPGACEAAFDADIARVDAIAANSGVACRFLDNQDGTISDLNTLLMWEKKDLVGGVHDVNNTYTWADAAEWAQNLNGKLTGNMSQGNASVVAFAGHTDWRLPSLFELVTILAAEAPNCLSSPCVDPVFNNGVNSFTADSEYWSSTTTEFIPEFAQLVGFSGGLTMLGQSKNLPFRARAVRGNR